MIPDGYTPFPRLGPCPVEPTARVRVLFRGAKDEPPIESADTYEARALRWDKHKGQKAPMPFDILAYKVVVG